MDIAPHDLNRIHDLYSRGLCLQAYQQAVALAPLHEWKGTPARLMAGRLAINLGAPRLAAWHHYDTWRKDPSHPEACYYYGRLLLQRRGPWAAQRFLHQSGDLPDASPAIRADWLASHGCVAGILRDFEAAEGYLARAEQISPDRPWICIERSTLFEMEDRYEEALASARRGLELQPWYRPAVQAVAHVLQLLGREREALDLLIEASQRIENGPVMLQLAAWQLELQHYADAARSYERYAELSPLMEKAIVEWLAARRCDVSYYLGDHGKAAEFARQVNEPFYQKLADHFAEPTAQGKRIVLPVGFVRQHHMTCAPATLSAISRFWNMPSDHLGVAEAICYDGTPNHNERQWAEEHGWRTREFTVTWDSAVALIDRGVPFTLTTVEPASAHLQAVMGYDSHRGSLIVRDPYERHFVEFVVEQMLQRYRATGPRGMAMVPKEQAHLLDNLELPDEPLYDLFYQLQLALKVHDRERAEQQHTAMETQAPEHRLTVLARRYLAGYDGNATEALASSDQMLKLYPDDVSARLTRVSCLRELGRREERLELLREMCAKPDSDPICWQQLAQELSNDAREHTRAVHLLRRSIRHRPTQASLFACLASIRWDQRRFAEALDLYRAASCLDDKDEGLARSYFIASRHFRLAPTALQMLQHRFQRFGSRSSLPVRTLFWAHNQLEQTPQAFAALEQALAFPAADGDLRLFAAEMYSAYGKTERAADLLEAARGQTHQAAWLRTAAGLASQRGDLPAALALWREILADDPLAVDAHRSVVQLLAETESRAAALDHLRQICERFPHHYGLHHLYVEWLREEGPAALEVVVRRVIASHPTDPWARRELALVLADQHRFDAAHDQLEVARRMEPASISYFLVRARVCGLAGRTTEARKAYREAIRLSADCELAIAELINGCDTLAERRVELAFIEGELTQQVLFGDGLLAYREHARYSLPPDELLDLLKKALEARPDLWHAWSAVIQQLAGMERLDEAVELARQATTRFPLLPRLWLDLAYVCQRLDNREGERDALRHTLEISPSWGTAIRQLAGLYEREGQLDEARGLLEHAVARAPLDAATHAHLAELLWRMDEREAALDRLRHGLRLEPRMERAWSCLQDWSRAVDQPGMAAEFARDLTQRRGGETNSWLWLARVLPRPEDLEERLSALNSALGLNPRSFEAYDLKAELLAEAGRFEQALAACHPTAYDGQPPLHLRGRGAWVEAKRGNSAEAIRQMRVLVTEDPNYYWAWEQLASWLRNEGPVQDYLEAAQALARLAPQNPTALAYSGEAKMRSGDRAGAKADFRRALELAPDFRFVAFYLFDEQLADNELDDAARTLEVLKQHIGGEHVSFREAQLALRHDDRETAQQALEQALTTNPAFVDACDLKAELLAGEERYEEALAVCRSEVWDGPPPVSVRGRAAWIEAKRGHREAAIAQMRELVKEDPTYFWGWERLAEWYRHLGDTANYRATSEELVRLSPTNPTSHGYLGEARLRSGDRAGAKESLRHAMQLSPDYRFAGFTLFDEQLADNELDDAAATLALLKPHIDPADGCYREAQLARRREDAAAALTALDNALAADPRHGEARDLKAELLSGEERYDEAVAACGPAEGEEAAPLFLRGRAAWVEKERGQQDEAIRQMRALVAEDPSYVWGWGRLAEWYREAEDNTGYAEVARELLRLAPDNPTYFAYSGEAKERSGDRAGAKADFSRAAELAPDYHFANYHLFDLHLDDGELDAAGAPLERLRLHAAGPYALIRAVRLSVKRNDKDACLGTLKQLAEGDGGGQVDEAVKLATEAGWGNEVDRTLEAALDMEQPNGDACRLWVERQVANGRGKSCPDPIEKLLPKGEAGKQTLIAYLKALAQAKDPDGVKQTVARFREPLRADGWAWGSVGDVLERIRDFPAAVEWMADWAERKDVEPWMLVNLVLALRGLERPDEASRVSEHALTLDEDDWTLPLHAVWLALEDALSGATDKAAGRLEEVDSDDLDSYHRLLRLWTDALVEVQRAGGGRQTLATARKRLGEAAGAIDQVRHDPALIVSWRRLVLRMARDCGGISARLWARWRASRPLLPQAKA